MTHAAGKLIHELKQISPQRRPVADVVRESCLGADGFGVAIGDHLATVLTVSQSPQVPAHGAEMIDEWVIMSSPSRRNGSGAIASEKNDRNFPQRRQPRRIK
jgi:hypothetical protein